MWNDAHVALRIEMGQMLVKPVLATLDRNVIDGNLNALEVTRGATRKMDLDRCSDLAAAERRSRCASAEQRLIDVVMQHGAKVIEIEACEPAAYCLRQGVANRIRMADAFALHEFQGQRMRGWTVQRSDINDHVAHRSWRLRFAQSASRLPELAGQAL